MNENAGSFAENRSCARKNHAFAPRNMLVFVDASRRKHCATPHRPDRASAQDARTAVFTRERYTTERVFRHCDDARLFRWICDFCRCPARFSAALPFKKFLRSQRGTQVGDVVGKFWLRDTRLRFLL